MAETESKAQREPAGPEVGHKEGMQEEAPAIATAGGPVPEPPDQAQVQKPPPAPKQQPTSVKQQKERGAQEGGLVANTVGEAASAAGDLGEYVDLYMYYFYSAVCVQQCFRR
eukprot:1161944-Pelagomonas_calceolata.AAC.20